MEHPIPESFDQTLDQDYWWKDNEKGWIAVDDIDPSHLVGIHRFLARSEHIATPMGQYVEWLHDELDAEYYGDLARGEVGPSDMRTFPMVNRWRVGPVVAGILAAD